MKKINLLQKFICCISIVLFTSHLVSAQPRIYVNEYLNIGVGARGLALSGAQSASVNDAFSAYWNPAGLSYIENDFQLGLMHAEYFGGISNYEYGSIAFPFQNKKRVLAISFIRFGTDNIPYTLDYIRPDGSFDESKLRGISAGDYASMISYAQKLALTKINPNLQGRIGFNAKILYRNIGKMANAWGAGFDLGLQLDYKRWIFGAMFRDITTTYTSWSFNLTEEEKRIFGATGNEIPVKSFEVMLPRFNLGAGYHFIKREKKFGLLTELGIDISTDGKRNTLIATNQISIDPKLGVEADYKETIFLRAGVGNFYKAMDNTDTTNQKYFVVYHPSVGVGLKLNSIQVDYAFSSLQVQDAPLMSHIISLRVDINKKTKKIKSNEDLNIGNDNSSEEEVINIK